MEVAEHLPKYVLTCLCVGLILGTKRYLALTDCLSKFKVLVVPGFVCVVVDGVFFHNDGE